MAETDTSYLSIGEVLGLLLEEFPDVTISKIRFLESQGLIAPERTPSGYRKFYDADVELLRVILREQRENYLPLRVIKDRLDSGAIDPSGEVAKPTATDGTDGTDGTAPEPVEPAVVEPALVELGVLDGGRSTVEPADEPVEPAEVPAATVAAHPAASRTLPGAPARPAPPAVTHTPGPDHTPVVPQLLPGVMLDRGELCAMTGVTAAELTQLESFGIVNPRGSGANALYNDDAVETARIAADLMRAGIDARHLRGWRNAADREASLYEQLITPRLRQRSPEARADALEQLRHLDALGAKLRTAMMRTALRHHFEG